VRQSIELGNHQGRATSTNMHEQGDNMKKSSLALALALTMGVMSIPSAYAVDDVCAAGPAHCKILKEDAKVRVIDYTAKKGDKVAMHSHPAHVIYILTGGKTRFTMADGSVKEIDAKPGDAMINPAVTHATETLSDLHAIIVEMKE
jgi:quercetin dioxygenase-like cupin family protein